MSDSTPRRQLWAGVFVAVGIFSVAWLLEPGPASPPAPSTTDTPPSTAPTTPDEAPSVPLTATELIDSVLGSGTRAGYLFGSSSGATTSEFIWFCETVHAPPSPAEDRWFSTEGVTLNSIDCQLPSNVQPVER